MAPAPIVALTATATVDGPKRGNSSTLSIHILFVTSSSAGPSSV